MISSNSQIIDSMFNRFLHVSGHTISLKSLHHVLVVRLAIAWFTCGHGDFTYSLSPHLSVRLGDHMLYPTHEDVEDEVQNNEYNDCV